MSNKSITGDIKAVGGVVGAAVGAVGRRLSFARGGGSIPQGINTDTIAASTSNKNNKNSYLNHQYEKLRAGLTPEQIKDFTDSFNLFDKDKSGFIDKKELALCIKALGYEPTPREVLNMIALVDTDRGGEISLDEFQTLMALQLSIPIASDELTDAFRSFDSDNSGFITIDNLREAMTELLPPGVTMTEEEFKEMLVDAKPNREGKIFYADFVKLMTSE
jgi:Ca2+-binding EF-hand superfamily protein